MYWGNWMKRTADSSTTSESCPKSTSHGRRASGIAFGSIHTAITPSTPGRYGNGGSGQSNKGSKEQFSLYMMASFNPGMDKQPRGPDAAFLKREQQKPLPLLP